MRRKEYNKKIFSSLRNIGGADKFCFVKKISKAEFSKRLNTDPEKLYKEIIAIAEKQEAKKALTANQKLLITIYDNDNNVFQEVEITNLTKKEVTMLQEIYNNGFSWEKLKELIRYKGFSLQEFCRNTGEDAGNLTRKIKQKKKHLASVYFWEAVKELFALKVRGSKEIFTDVDREDFDSLIKQTYGTIYSLWNSEREFLVSNNVNHYVRYELMNQGKTKYKNERIRFVFDFLKQKKATQNE